MDYTERNKALGLALREAEFLLNLHHGNIIELHGFMEDILNDQICLVFPWAENGNLRDFVALVEWEVPERMWLVNIRFDHLSRACTNNSNLDSWHNRRTVVSA